jgi:hypothetical protein
MANVARIMKYLVHSLQKPFAPDLQLTTYLGRYQLLLNIHTAQLLP